MDTYQSQVLDEWFSPALAGAAYPDNEAYLLDIQTLVALYLGLAALYQQGDGEAEGEALSGGAMRPEEALAYLLDYPLSPEAPSEQMAALVRGGRGYIEGRLAAGGFVPPLEQLRGLLGLADFSFFCVACALASARDRAFERAFVALHGNTELLCPTLGAVASVWRLAAPLPPGALGRLQNPAGAENQLLLAPPAAEAAPPLLRPLRLRGPALAFLQGQPYLNSALLGRCHIITGEDPAPPKALYLEGQMETALAAVKRMGRREAPLLLALCGRAGSGRRLTLRHAARQSGQRLLLLDAHTLPWQDKSEELCAELLALALLHGALPCLPVPDGAGAVRQMEGLWAALRPWGLGVVLLAQPLRSNIVLEGWQVVQVEYPTPDYPQALGLWRHFAGRMPEGAALQKDVSLDQLAAKYVLSAGQIENALAGAALMAGLGGPGEVDEQALHQAVLRGNTGRLSEIADRIDAVYGWEDLVLDEGPKQALRDVCDRVCLRGVVESGWGYQKKGAAGGGISVLLYGPPGTGKTMSAQVIARQLGLPLYRINLAQVISKYIGETAKNLDAVFTEAKSSNVVLFFDEADALFARRTDVKDSNDRHANSESAYLLQKIEEYPGVSVLATNLMHNFDEAFRRRISYMINIHMPGPAQRLQMWRGMVPAAAPLAADVDLEALAGGLEFSGSVIKSASVQAAYFAAAGGGEITMRHYIRAVRMELQKLGKSEPHFLSAWPG